MAIAGVAVGTLGTATSGNLSVPYPAGWAADQVGIMFVYKKGAAGTLAVPGDWTPLAGGINATAGSNEAMFAAYRVLAGGDSTPVTVTDDGTIGKVGFIRTFSGVDTTTPIDVDGTWNNTASATDGNCVGTSINIATLNAALVFLLGFGDDATGTDPFGAVPSMSLAVNLESLIGNDMSVGLAEQFGLSTGATGTRTSVYDSVASARASGLLFALKPGAGGGGGSGPPIGSLTLLGVGR